MKTTRHTTFWISLVCVVGALSGSPEAFAQICKPVSQRTGEVGCWITANADLGQLPQEPIFWHLDTYSTRADAEAAKGPRGTVVESLGKVWLLTVDASSWRPSAGTRVAEVGPLPISGTANYPRSTWRRSSLQE